MLRFDRVTKRFGETVAAKEIELTLPTSQTTVLIGPSGCGKSTLMHLAAGLIEPDEGTVSLDGTVLSADTVLALRRRMGYVIQDGGLFPHLTVERNVDLMARHLGWPGERIAERHAELTRLVRLPAELMRRYPAQLSGGQRQRVSLMRALMLDPELLLLDEPLGALDPMIRYELQLELKEIFATLGKTVLLVTHDIAEAAFFGHTLVLMRDGSIVQHGSLAELARTPAEPFVTRFIRAQREPLRILGEALS